MSINDGLTEEERAALALDDNGDEVEPGDETDPPAEDPPAEDPPATDPPADAPAEEPPVVAPAADNGTRPAFVAEAPADADAKLTEIATKRSDLRKQYDDGDITFEEYDDAKDSLAKQERDIERAIDKANIAAEMQQQQARNDWDSTVGNFLKAHTQYKEGGVLYRALDMEVKRVATENPSLSYQAILAKAHEGIVAEFGEPAAKKGGDDPKPGLKKKELPPTLRNIPAAEHADTSGNKYAALDRLLETDPMAHEAALDRMSKAERDAYCAS